MDPNPLHSNSIFERPSREFTWEELYHRGLAAQRLLERDPLFADLLKDAEYSLLEQLRDAETPTEIYGVRQAMTLGLGALEQVLRAYISDGENARIALQENGALPEDE